MRLIEVDADAIRIQIEQLKGCLGNAKNTTAELATSIESLQAMWTGEAHDEFVISCMRNREEMENMCLILENIIQSMEMAEKEYNGCEEEIGHAISSFRLP